jgi:hypothetical protein
MTPDLQAEEFVSDAANRIVVPDSQPLILTHCWGRVESIGDRDEGLVHTHSF